MGINRRARVGGGDATGGMRVGTVRESKSAPKGLKGVKMAQSRAKWLKMAQNRLKIGQNSSK